MKKTVWVILLAILFIFSFSAVASSADESADEILKKMSDASKEISTVEANVTADMKLLQDETVYPIDIMMELSVIKNPLTMKMATSYSAEGQTASAMDMYVIPHADTFTAYINYGSKWLTQDLTAELLPLVTDQFSDSIDTAKYTDYTSDLTLLPDDEIMGKKVKVIKGVISGESLNKMMSSNSYLSTMSDQLPSETGSGAENAAVDYSGYNDVEVTFYIDSEKYLPVRFELDMGRFMQDVMKNSSKTEPSETPGAEVTDTAKKNSIEDFNMIIDYKSVNEAIEISLPEEALQNKSAN